MNKRIRKKQLKKLNRYIPYSELWDLDSTICDWIIPRLRKFKEKTNGYPGTEEVPTFEAWMEIIDKMIKGFEMAKISPSDDESGLDLFDENCRLKVDIKTYGERVAKWDTEQYECLCLFAKYFNYLWI